MTHLDGYDFGFLKEPYARAHPEFAPHFGEAAQELKKFLNLPNGLPGPLAAMSHKVDGLWHEFISHTPQYADFCMRQYGQYLHHQPRSDAVPVPLEAISNFYKGYPKRYGKVPHIWLEDIPPTLVGAVVRGETPSALNQLQWSGWPGWK